MSEPIKWQQLTPAQRDVLVHTKVMGERLNCAGKLHKLERDDERARTTYVCLECRAVLSITDYYLSQCPHPDQHEKYVPAYSSDLNSVWKALLVAGFGGKYTGKSDIRVLARELLGTNEHDLDPFYILGFVSAWTPESICIAALRACGFEVNNERS